MSQIQMNWRPWRGLVTLITQGLVMYAYAYATKEPVRTEVLQGKLEGVRITRNDNFESSKTNVIDAYLAIPYARPPVEEHRFRNPDTAAVWQGIKNATLPGPVCPQPHTEYLVEGGWDMDEDCLILNVHSPFEAGNPAAKYPVMFYIHGGSYSSGSGYMYTGEVLAQTGVVVVTINYRLGFFGFFTDENSLSGNYGLYDQLLALQWTKDNIGAFRGDPDLITIFGNSAGGSSVGLHLFSPLSQGLFHRAIIQSGPPNAFWAVHNKTVNLQSYAREVAEKLNCNFNGDPDVECLQKQHWANILDKTEHLPRISPSNTNMKPWIDGRFVLESPDYNLQMGVFHKVPTMIGFTTSEWASNIGWFLREYFTERNKNPTKNWELDRQTFLDCIDHVVTVRFGWDKAVSEVIKNMYTDWDNINDQNITRQKYIDFVSDLSLVVPSIYMGARLAKADDSQVYMYSFDVTSSIFPKKWMGSYHGNELNYLFGSPFTGLNVDGQEGRYRVFTEDDKRESGNVMELWSNFAKYGKPTPEGHKKGTYWSLMSEEGEYLHISNKKAVMKKQLKPDKVAFWQKLIPKLQNMVTSSRYELEDKGLATWIFACISIVLLLIIIVLIVALVRSHVSEDLKYKRASNSGSSPEFV
ncbi:unnamed protein product [Owenia fusiformis]|uniref:Carboxylic ester hydrolase n=1 Tax=Owenia fusiformis TaxID=6347 RepID=A0A8S4Q6R4_OWEFU|nr:unnamed protein product [Owenia fusiformis]